MPVALLLLWSFFAVRAYMRAQRFEHQYGHELGGCPAFVWAIICFVIGLIGVIVQIFVMRSAVKKSKQMTTVWTPAAAPPVGQWAPPPGMSVPFQPGPNVGGSEFLPRKN